MFRTLLAILLVVLPMASASATTVLHIKDGGTLEGELLNPDEINRKIYRVQTTEGLTISIDAQLVDRQQPRQREALIEYNRDVSLTHNTVENHLRWARWCNDQQLLDQAKLHWQQVLELDPDHTDARSVLGYVKTATGWESLRSRRENRGLVEDRGRWKTPHQIEVETILGNQRAETAHWKKTVSELYRRLPNPQAEAEFLSLRHPGAVAPIVEILVRENNPQRRIMLLRLLMQIPDASAIQLVAGWSVRPDEPLDEIRKMCIEELQRQIPYRPEIRPNMIAVYRDCLRTPNVDWAIINLACGVLADIGGYEAVPELIDVLVVTRTETIQPPTPGYTFGSGGSGVSQPGRAVTRRVPIENQAALSALRRLTDVNFGFNQSAWRDWYRQSHRSPTINLRRD